jgi:hypothetical protein
MASFVTVRDSKAPGLEEAIQIFARGNPPLVIDGNRWWEVGQNASHTFYLGLDASGALYQSAIDWFDVDVGYKAPGVEKTDSFEHELTRNCRPVKDGDQLYLGR